MKEIKNYAYIENLELSEYIAFPIYIIIILLISYYVQSKNVKKNPVYKYYTWGVMAKLLGAVSFCLVYIFYYKGGDTISYFETARSLSNLFLERPGDYFKVIFEKPSIENYYLFDGKTTGYPWPYMYYDSKTFLVAKVLVPFMLASFQSFMLATILFSWISFFGIWRLYLLFSSYYNSYYKQLAIAILFVPSAVFWGSGILKDTITLSASCWYIYSFYQCFIAKKKRLKNVIILIVVSYLILNIKPYIFIALLPGSIIWFFYEKILKIRSKIIRYSIIPFGFFLSIAIGYTSLSLFSEFDIDKLLIDASVKQNDLKRVEYNGNSFDIGSYEPTVLGALVVSPAALVAGLYRPFIWEAKNVVMLFSGLENFCYLFLTLLILLKLRIGRVLKIIFENPLIIFTLSYSIILALIVGLSTSNFGALVRFKIAFMPEFISSLIVIYYLVYSYKKAK